MTIKHYRPDIDGLRSIAVIPVVLFHAGLGPFHGGFVGVDIFFVISGFLITRILLKEMENQNYSILNFYNRRFRRILPALLFLFVATSVAACALYLPSDLSDFGSRLASSAAFIANYDFYSTSNYFGPKADTIELLHLWSLAVEEQFYIFFPPFLFLIWKRFGLKGAVIAIGAIASISFALSAWGVYAFRAATFYLLPTRAWELMIGSLLATAIFPLATTRTANFAGVSGLAAILVSIFAYSARTPFPGPAALLPCLGAAAVIWSGTVPNSVAARILSLKPFVWIGLISYSLYLWHWPILVFSVYYLDRPLTPSEASLAVFASLLMAYVSWKFVEAPFRTPTSAKSAWTPLIVSLFLLSLVAGFGLSLKTLNGLPQRVSPAVIETQSAQSDIDDSLCRKAGDPRCKQTATVVVWGDSHAQHHMPALAEIYGKSHVARMGGPGCPPLMGVMPVTQPATGAHSATPTDIKAGERCQKTNDKVMAALDRKSGLRLIVLGGAWQFFSQGVELGTKEGRFLTDGAGGDLSIARSRMLLRKSLLTTVERLRGKGYQVLLIGDVPASETPPSACLGKALMFNRSEASCELPKSAHSDLSFSNDLLKQIAFTTGSKVFLPSETLCPRGQCLVRIKGKLVYQDEDHLTASASRELAKDIAVVMRK